MKPFLGALLIAGGLVAVSCAVNTASGSAHLDNDEIYGQNVSLDGHQIPCVVIDHLNSSSESVAVSCDFNGLTVAS